MTLGKRTHQADRSSSWAEFVSGSSHGPFVCGLLVDSCVVKQNEKIAQSSSLSRCLLLAHQVQSYRLLENEKKLDFVPKSLLKRPASAAVS